MEQLRDCHIYTMIVALALSTGMLSHLTFYWTRILKPISLILVLPRVCAPQRHIRPLISWELLDTLIQSMLGLPDLLKSPMFTALALCCLNCSQEGKQWTMNQISTNWSVQIYCMSYFTNALNVIVITLDALVASY